MPEFTFIQSIPIFSIFLASFVLIIVCYQTGFYLKRLRILKNQVPDNFDFGTVTGTLLAMLGLFLAFTFNMASSRYDERKNIIIQEANDISTAYLRTQLYPDSLQKILKGYFKEYVEERIAYFEAGRDLEKVIDHYNKANIISDKIWKTVTDYSKIDKQSNRIMLVAPVLNQMFDIKLTRLSQSEAKIPDSILYILLFLSFSSIFLLGYESKKKMDMVLLIGFAFTLSAIIFTILDLDRSRQGLIDLNSQNKKIVELREMFKGN